MTVLASAVSRTPAGDRVSLISTFQARLDRGFDLLVQGRIGRGYYADRVDDICSSMPEWMSDSLLGRIDRRSPGKFAVGLYDRTRRERYLVDRWRTDVVPEWELEVEDHGIDNSGRVIIDCVGENGRPDFLAKSRFGRWLLEVKFDPVRNFATYKEIDLENYSGLPDVRMLTIMAPGMVGPDGDPEDDRPFEMPSGAEWFLLDRAQIEAMRGWGEKGRHKGFGGKPTRRYYRREFARLGQVLDWSNEVVKLP